MTNWLRKIMPSEEKFFPLFERHADQVEAGAKALRSMLLDGGAGPAGNDDLTGISKEAAATAREILDKIRGSFVTPFDRADIKEMTVSMQAVLDDMNGVARAVGSANNGTAASDLGRFGDLVAECAGELKRGVKLLEEVDKHADELRAMRDKIGAARIRMSEMGDDAILKLLDGGADAPLRTLAAIKLLERIGAVVERFDAVADHIDDLVLDHV